MRILVAFSLFVLFLVNNSFAQRSKINELTEETQQLSNDDDKMRLVWWIPNEFWETAFASEESLSQEEIDQFLGIFEDYTILAIADGVISDYGDVKYENINTILNSTFITKNNKAYHPFPEDEVTGDVKIVLGMLKPVLANMLGNMGENIHFIVFDGYNSKDQRLIEPLEDDDFSVSVGEEQFFYNLPLGSLMPPKSCKKHPQAMNGAWDYCPYCGNKLVIYED